MSFNPQKFLKDKIKGDIKTLYVQFIYILEDLVDKNQITEDEFLLLRKRVLDYGNNTTRNLEEQIDNFEIRIDINEKKDDRE